MAIDLPNWIAGESVSATKLNRMSEAIRLQGVPDSSDPRRVQRMRPWQMFDIECSAPGKIRVHAGCWARWTAGGDKVISSAVDSGTSVDAEDDFKTLDTFSASTTHYVYALLDSATLPTTCTIGKATSAPTDTNNVYRILGTVRTDASSNIVEIIQWHRGLIRDALSAFPTVDDKSIDNDYNGTDTGLELYNYHWCSSSTSTPDSDSLFPFCPGTDGLGVPEALSYCTHSAMVDWLDDSFSLIGHTHTWDSLSDVADFAAGTALDLPRLNAAKNAIEWVHPTDVLSTLGGADLSGLFVDGLFTNTDSYGKVTFRAVSPTDGNVHSYTAIGIDNGAI